MKNKVIVLAQYYEKYKDFDPIANPYWKPKGGIKFIVEMNTDILMYTDANEIFAKMVAEKSNFHCKYEYLEYYIQWDEPRVLGTEEDYLNVYESLKA